MKEKVENLLRNIGKKKCPGAEVLDYACGNGEDTRDMAKLGAKKVTGIDISDVSVEMEKIS